MQLSHLVCQVCGTKEGPMVCARCRIVYYCSSEHLRADRDSGHKEVYREIGEVLAYLQIAPSEERHVVRIYDLLPLYLKLDSADAVQISVNYLFDVLGSQPTTRAVGFRNFLPVQLLRLGRDQDCYDFTKWSVGEDATVPYDDDRAAGFKNSNVFERVTDFYSQRSTDDVFSLEESRAVEFVCVILIKIKVLRDIEALSKSRIIAAKVPQEILDHISGYVVSPIVANMKAVMGSEDLSQLAKDMRFQIMHLYDLVERENSHFWSEFFTPGSCAAIDVLDTQALKKDHKLLAQRVLAICNKSWVETPGAMETLRRVVGSHSDRV